MLLDHGEADGFAGEPQVDVGAGRLAWSRCRAGEALPHLLVSALRLRAAPRRGAGGGGTAAGGREGTVLLNWGQWTDLDSVTINDFIEAFWDFWYPKADDLDILSVTFEWIVSIDYDGWIYVAHL